MPTASTLPTVDSTCSSPSACTRAAGRDGLGDQRDGQPEHAADAEAGEESAGGEVEPRSG